MQEAAEAADMRSHANSWALSHRKMVFKAPLPQALEHRIRLWFQSLDKNSSGALSKEEMAAAMDMGTDMRAVILVVVVAMLAA